MIKEYAKQMVSLLFLLSGIALSSSAQKQQVWKPFYDKCRREKSIIDAIPTELEKALQKRLLPVLDEIAADRDKALSE